MENGVRDVAGIMAILAGLGLISQAIVITGLGARLSEILVALVGGSTIGIVIISVVITLILGCGMPTPIAYVLVAMFVGPAMIQAGFPLLATHMFLFYFAIKSGSTPPVAVVSAVGAGIAGADFWKTAVKSTVFSLASTLIAFGFLYNQALLLVGNPLCSSLSIPWPLSWRLCDGRHGSGLVVYPMQRPGKNRIVRRGCVSHRAGDHHRHSRGGDRRGGHVSLPPKIQGRTVCPGSFRFVTTPCFLGRVGCRRHRKV